MDYPGRTIKKGEKDAVIVRTIQQQLNLKGLGPVNEDGIFDEITESAVKEFQSQSRDSYGNPLVYDGKVGPITWSVLFGLPDSLPDHNTSHPGLFAETLKIAAGELGVMEVPPGSNRGTMVEVYQARAGINPGDPWCAAFVYWCFSEASLALGLSNPLPRTGSCMGHWDTTSGRKILNRYATDNPGILRPGDIFIIDHGNYRGHTGIVAGINNGYIRTIEGISNVNGSREGLAVVSLERKIITIKPGFIDYNG